MIQQRCGNIVKNVLNLGIPYLFDPSQQVARNPHADLKYGVEHAHAVFCNEYEFDLLQKHTGFSAREIENKVEILVVTLGENGAQFCLKEYSIQFQ